MICFIEFHDYLKEEDVCAVYITSGQKKHTFNYSLKWTCALNMVEESVLLT